MPPHALLSVLVLALAALPGVMITSQPAALACFECDTNCTQGSLWHKDPFPPSPEGVWEPYLSDHSSDCVNETCNSQHDDTCGRFAAGFGSPRDIVDRIMRTGIEATVAFTAMNNSPVRFDTAHQHVQVLGCDGLVYANIPVASLRGIAAN